MLPHLATLNIKFQYFNKHEHHPKTTHLEIDTVQHCDSTGCLHPQSCWFYFGESKIKIHDTLYTYTHISMQTTYRKTYVQYTHLQNTLILVVFNYFIGNIHMHPCLKYIQSKQRYTETEYIATKYPIAVIHIYSTQVNKGLNMSLRVHLHCSKRLTHGCGWPSSADLG